jgi:hypothetical protein
MNAIEEDGEERFFVAALLGVTTRVGVGETSTISTAMAGN